MSSSSLLLYHLCMHNSLLQSVPNLNPLQPSQNTNSPAVADMLLPFDQSDLPEDFLEKCEYGWRCRQGYGWSCRQGYVWAMCRQGYVWSICGLSYG